MYQGSNSARPFTRKQIAIIFKIAFLEAMALSIILPSAQSTGEVTIQNSCTGLLLQYGRCEQNLNGQMVTIPSSGMINFQVNFTTPFTHAPFVTPILIANPFSGLGQFNDPLLLQNGTRTAGTCIGCTTFVFPSANTFGLLPSGSGYATIDGGDFAPNNNFPSHVTFAMLNINVVSISNATSNGRNLWIQGLDPDVHGDLSCVSQWESLSDVKLNGVSQRPGLTNNGQSPIFNWGVGFQHGDRIPSVGESGNPSPINQTIINDILNSFLTCTSSEDLPIRVVGSITSGHETITYSSLYVTFFYPVVTGAITLTGITTTSFILNVEGQPGLVITFIWKAVSETG